MDLSTAFQVLILWAHAMAAIAWVGGSLFYVAAINPAVEQVGKTPDRLALLGAISREFREVVRVAIVVFVATGAVLVFSRLSFTRLSPTYVVVLAVKIVLSLWMFWLAGRLGPRVGEAAVSWLSKLPFAGWLRPQYVILLLGIVIVALSYVLRALYEQALGSAL
ncbi:MAG TPA: hypothetical protein VMW65_01820 [Chloroflexota bacterium]|nr:hypothetical protein [Chloroflexota bacterium]